MEQASAQKHALHYGSKGPRTPGGYGGGSITSKNGGGAFGSTGIVAFTGCVTGIDAGIGADGAQIEQVQIDCEGIVDGGMIGVELAGDHEGIVVLELTRGCEGIDVLATNCEGQLAGGCEGIIVLGVNVGVGMREAPKFSSARHARHLQGGEVSWGGSCILAATCATHSWQGQVGANSTLCFALRTGGGGGGGTSESELEM